MLSKFFFATAALLCALIFTNSVFAKSAIKTKLNPSFVTCYNDDSQDVVNNEELPMPPPWNALPAQAPNPADCGQGPAVVISARGEVFVDGVKIYDNSSDTVYEARVAPTGVVALYTQYGSLLVYSKTKGLKSWFRGGSDQIAHFKLARNGNVLAISRSGELVVSGRETSINNIHGLYASASGRIVAIDAEGSVYDENKRELFHAWIEKAVQVKIAPNGTVVWLTNEGKVGSTKGIKPFPSSFDQLKSFKINADGKTVGLTQNGKLWREGQEIYSGLTPIVRYRIQPNGAVSAVDSDGKAHFFR